MQLNHHFLTAVALLGLSCVIVGCNNTKSTRREPNTTHPTTTTAGGPPSHAPAHGYRRKHQFYYYPVAQVYRDCEVDRWFWLEAGQWAVGVKLPDRIVLDSEPPLVVEWDSDTPYAHYAMITSQSGSASHPGKGHAYGHNKGKAKGHQKHGVKSASAEGLQD